MHVSFSSLQNSYHPPIVPPVTVVDAPVAEVGVRSIESLQVELQTPRLRHNRMRKLSYPAPNSQKTHSVGMALFSNCWANCKKLTFDYFIDTRLVTTGLNIGYRFLRLGSPSKDAYEKINEHVKQISGSEDLLTFIHTFSPWLAAKLTSYCEKSTDWKSFINFLSSQQQSLESCLNYLLSVSFINIAEDIRKKQIGVDAEAESHINLADVIDYIFKLCEGSIKQLNEFEKIPNLEKRKKKQLDCLEALVRDFFVIALPKGVSELPFWTLSYFSNPRLEKFKKDQLPLILLSIYQEFIKPFKDDPKEKLFDLDSGLTLLSLAEISAATTAETLPTLLLHEDTEKPTELVNTLLNELDSILGLSPEVLSPLKSWIAGQIVILGKHQGIGLKVFWNSIGRYVATCLNHIFYNLSKNPPFSEEHSDAPNLPDAIGTSLIKVLCILSDFINANLETIQMRLNDQKEIKIEELYEDSVALKDIFTELTQGILNAIGLSSPEDLPVPKGVKAVIFPFLQQFLFKFLMNECVAFMTISTQEKKVRSELRKLIFDDKKIQDPEVMKKTDIEWFSKIKAANQFPVSSESLLEEMNQILWNNSGNESIATIIEKICKVYANDIIDAIMKKFGISSQRFFAENDNEFMRQVNVYLKKWLETTLLQVFINLVKTTEQQKIPNNTEHPQKYLLMSTIVRLGQIFTQSFKNIEDNLKLIKALPEDEQQKSTRNLFLNLSRDLQAIIGINPFQAFPLDGLPTPDKVKSILWEVVRKVALPDYLYTAYSEMTSWQRDLKESRAILQGSYHTTYPKETCNILAHFASDFIRHFLAHSKEDVAKLLLNSLKDTFSTKGFLGESLSNDLMNSFDKIISLLCANIGLIAESNDAGLIHVWPALTSYIEAAIAKIFAEFSVAVSMVEENNEDFMIDLVTRLLRETNHYFKAVTDVTKASGEEDSYSVNSQLIYATLGKSLHEGVPLDPKLSPEEKTKVRLEGNFIPLVAKLMDLADISIDKLPILSPFIDTLGDVLLTKVLPLVLMHSNLKILDHSVRDSLMLTFIDNLYSALNEIPLSKNEVEKEQLPKISSPKPSPKDKNLNKECGDLIQALVQLIPDTFVQYVFMKKRVQEMSAEAIGNAIKNKLNSLTLRGIINKILFSSLPGLHLSKWEGKEREEKLVPYRLVTKLAGKKELREMKSFKFIFPTDPEEIALEAKVKEQKAIETRTKLRDSFTRTISSQLHINTWKFINKLWDDFQLQCDELIANYTGDVGTSIKSFLDTVFRKIFFDWLGPILQFLSSPLLNLGKYILEKTYIDYKSDDIIQNLHSDTLEHLVYKGINTILDLLIEQKKEFNTNKKLNASI